MELLFVFLAAIILLVGGLIWRANRAKTEEDNGLSPIDPFPPVQQPKAVEAKAVEAKAVETKAVETKAVETKAAPKKAAPKKAAAKSLPTDSKLKSMTKLEIEAVGREFGTELDRRKTKDNMIKDLHTHLKKK